MPLPLSMADDFRQFQDLIRRVADKLQIPMEEVKDLQHKLLDVLQSAIVSRLVLPVSEALLDPAKTVWQTLATIPPMCKMVDKKYYAPFKDSDLFSHPPPNSLVVDVVNKQGRQHFLRLTAMTRIKSDWIFLD